MKKLLILMILSGLSNTNIQAVCSNLNNPGVVSTENASPSGIIAYYQGYTQNKNFSLAAKTPFDMCANRCLGSYLLPAYDQTSYPIVSNPNQSISTSQLNSVAVCINKTCNSPYTQLYPDSVLTNIIKTWLGVLHAGCVTGIIWGSPSN